MKAIRPRGDIRAFTTRQFAHASALLLAFAGCGVPPDSPQPLVGESRQAVSNPVTVQQTLEVTATPLWTDGGFDLHDGDQVTISGASGSWTWGGGNMFGPDGDPRPDLAWDEWIQDGQHGQLIGAILPAGVDPNALPRVVSPGDPAMFPIGTSTLTKTGVSGHLWLGFNDDYQTDATIDNAGSVAVLLTLVAAADEPECVSVEVPFPFEAQPSVLLVPCMQIDKAGTLVTIKIHEGKDFDAKSFGFNFYEVMDGSKVSGVNTYQDTDSAQVALKSTGGDAPKFASNVQPNGKPRGTAENAGATWIRAAETEKGKREVSWRVKIAEDAKHLEVILVYTDALLNTPAEVGRNNQNGDMPVILGSWSADLKDKEWKVTARPDEVIKAKKGYPDGPAIATAVAAVQKLVKDRTDYVLQARPIGLKGISFPMPPKLTKTDIGDIIDAAVTKEINKYTDTGFDLQP
jgi:hypothetical protein